MLGPAPVSPEKRRAYVVHLGGGIVAPVEMWEWCCSGCAARPREHDKAKLELRMRNHVCDA
jgi:hypothetical protein